MHTIGLAGTTDLVTLGYAAARSMVVVTANRNDFLRLSRDLVGRREPTAAIVIARTSALPAGGVLPFHLARAGPMGRPAPETGAHPVLAARGRLRHRPGPRYRSSRVQAWAGSKETFQARSGPGPAITLR